MINFVFLCSYWIIVLYFYSNLGQEMAINFVFLCTEVCWKGLGATHMLEFYHCDDDCINDTFHRPHSRVAKFNFFTCKGSGQKKN